MSAYFEEPHEYEGEARFPKADQENRGNSGHTSGLAETSSGERTEEKAKNAQERIDAKVAQTINETKQRGYHIMADQKHHAAQEFRKYGDAFHTAAQRLQEQNGAFADTIENAARQLDKASRYMDEHSTGEVFHSANDYARKHTGIFWGGMFFAGLAASRFFRASQSAQTHTPPEGGY